MLSITGTITLVCVSLVALLIIRPSTLRLTWRTKKHLARIDYQANRRIK